MRLNYKQLGQYIEPVNIRNKDLSVETLLGVSIQKCFMPSIANTVGTDMSKYKVVKRNQFAYGPVTSRNGDKISVALLEDFDSAIISQAYIVFQVIDQEQLDPEYLMMWFRRPEFDRYARFMSHGSARETFDWEEMCEVELPVPSIEKQREIVKEYNTIVNRIKLNEELNQKLEETLDTFFHEFISVENYSGDETAHDFIDIANTGLDAIKRAPIVDYNTGIKCLRIQDVSREKGFDDWGYTEVDKPNFKKFQLKKDDIIIARTGATVGCHMFIKKDFDSVFNNGLIRVRANRKKVYPSILYSFFCTKGFKDHVESIAFGTSTQPNVKIGELFSYGVTFPSIEEQSIYVEKFNALNNMILSNKEQISSLLKMQEVILERMTQIVKSEYKSEE